MLQLHLKNQGLLFFDIKMFNGQKHNDEQLFPNRYDGDDRRPHHHESHF